MDTLQTVETPITYAQTAARHGASVATLTASSGGTITGAGAEVEARSAGFLLAISGAEPGLGSFHDIKAALDALETAQQRLAVLEAPQKAKNTAARALASALQAWTAFLNSRPALVTYTVDYTTSLSALCQRLYGSRALTAEAEIRRLNRIRRPWSIPAGTKLLISDPVVVAPEVV